MFSFLEQVEHILFYNFISLSLSFTHTRAYVKSEKKLVEVFFHYETFFKKRNNTGQTTFKLEVRK